MTTSLEVPEPKDLSPKMFFHMKGYYHFHQSIGNVVSFFFCGCDIVVMAHTPCRAVRGANNSIFSNRLNYFKEIVDG